MRLMPRTLFGQLLLALVSGMLVTLALSYWFIMGGRMRLLDHYMSAHVAQRVAGLVSILDDATPAERDRLVRLINADSSRRIALGESWGTPGQERSPRLSMLAGTLAQELGPRHPVQVLFLGRPARSARAASDEGQGLPDLSSGRYVLLNALVQVRLSDGAVLTLRQNFPAFHARETYLVVGSLVLMGFIIALLIGWVVSRLTRPLRALSEAAKGLVLNLDQPPVPVTGAIEVANAAGAFNAMQQEIRKLLETRTQALAGVSHDLRLPITRLRLRAERIADPTLKEAISSDLDEMDVMIASTLDFLRAGRSSEKPVRLNLWALLELIGEEMTAAGARVTLAGDAAVQTRSRPTAIRRCLTNLMDNARRYGGGVIEVEVAQRDGRVEIGIGDRGPGIPARDAERVFEPYVRLEASRSRDTGGTGLGLAIARAIARQEGGDIRLQSRPEGGLMVRLTLPAMVQ
jgi:signal transduction histidine kinase